MSQLLFSMVWDNSKGNSYSSSLFDCLFCFKLWSTMFVMIFTNQTTFIRCSSLETLELACGCEVSLKNMMPATFWTPLVDVINNVTKFFGIDVRKHLNLKWFISYLFNVVFLCSPRCSIKSSCSFKFQQKRFKPRCFGVHPRSFRPEFFGAMFHLWIATGWGRCHHKGMMNKSMMKGMKPCTSASHDLQGSFCVPGGAGFLPSTVWEGWHQFGDARVVPFFPKLVLLKLWQELNNSSICESSEFTCHLWICG